MAKCPKCGYKLKFYEIGQNCPKCKVNIRFYNFEEEFYRRAKLAEIDQAAFNVKLKHLKASFVGSKLIIVRLIICLLPLMMFVIPAGSFHFELPYKSFDMSVGLMGIMDIYNGNILNYIIEMRNSALVGAEFTAVLNAFAAYLVPALFALAILFGTMFVFTSIKKMQKVLCAFSALGIISAVAAQIVMYIQIGALKENLIFTGKASFGLYAVIIGFAAVFAVNFIIDKKGIPVEYDEGTLERAEIFKQYKAGKITLDELPFPVVETEETRKLKEKIRLEEEQIAREAQSK